ncbi:BREX-3 system P-loop-containing protein BrxF [Muricomes intestini]|uniref:BREX-3 system P-loop-containing protein BrxF n=1 Tax=Muricomes intestini TaxID=1796634 RepID=UPI002FE41D5E
MGEVIKFDDLKREQNMISRLLVYWKKIRQMSVSPVSISKPLSEELLKISPKNRSMRLSSCFRTVLSQYPDDVVIEGIDVMFNPAYQVDVLRILTETRKNKSYSVVWPGKYENGLLIYSEQGYPDYKTYEVRNYDITCVI